MISPKNTAGPNFSFYGPGIVFFILACMVLLTSMQIELKKIGYFQQAIGAISGFINEGNFRFNNQGLFFKAIDPSQVALVDYFVDKKLFDKFDVEPSFVGLDLVEFNKILQRAMPNDTLAMELSDAELTIKLEGDIIRTFHLPLIDVSEEEVNIPKPAFEAIIQINARVLKEILKDAALFSSSVVLKIKNNSFHVEAKGNNGILRTVAKEAKLVSVKSNGDITTKYSLNFLQNIIREADNEKKVSLELKNDAPMKISYQIGETTMQFFLAHMIL